MLINKENKEYRIHSFSVNSLFVLSTFAILLLYLSNTLLFQNINPAWADSVVASIPVGIEPTGVAYDSGNGMVFVANTDSDTVSVINTSTNTVVATIPVGTGTYLEHDAPIGVAYDSLNSAVYVTNERFNTVSVINTSTNKVIYTIYNANRSNPVELVGPASYCI